jgi:hypothetical protein
VKHDDKNNWLIVSLYVDDLIFTGNHSGMFQRFKDSMMKTFDMTDLGKMRHFLGVEVIQDSQGIFMCQHRCMQRKFLRDLAWRIAMQCVVLW